MTNRENALEIIRFGKPERVVGGWPDYTLHYLGCNHEGYEGGGHDLPVGSNGETSGKPNGTRNMKALWDSPRAIRLPI